MSGRVFLGWTSTKQGLICLAQGHNTVTGWGSNLRPLGLKSNALGSLTRPRSAVGNVSDCRYVSDCRSRVLRVESRPGEVPYFRGNYHEIISMVILLPSTDSRRVVVSHKPKYAYKVLFNRLGYIKATRLTRQPCKKVSKLIRNSWLRWKNVKLHFLV